MSFQGFTTLSPMYVGISQRCHMFPTMHGSKPGALRIFDGPHAMHGISHVAGVSNMGMDHGNGGGCQVTIRLND